MSNKQGVIVKNLSTSRVIDDIAENFGCQVVATPIGEIHVAKAMKEHQAVIGGEGNGGVMLPELHLGRDAPLAATLVLQLMAREKKTILQLRKELPDYHIWSFPFFLSF